MATPSNCRNNFLSNTKMLLVQTNFINLTKYFVESTQQVMYYKVDLLQSLEQWKEGGVKLSALLVLCWA